MRVFGPKLEEQRSQVSSGSLARQDQNNQEGDSLALAEFASADWKGRAWSDGQLGLSRRDGGERLIALRALHSRWVATLG